MTERSPGPPTKLAVGIVAALIVAGGIVRLAYARHTPGPFPVDAIYYSDVAESLATGRGMVIDYAWIYAREVESLPMPAMGYWMPGMSLYLAAWFAVLGPGFQAGQLAGIGLGLVLIALTWWAGRELTGKDEAGLLGAAIAAADPHLVLFSTTTDAVLLQGALLVAALVCLQKALRDDSRWLIGAGLLAGAAHLTRNDSLLIVPVAGLCALWAWRKGQYRPRWLDLAYFAGPYALVLGPWLIRNMLVFGSAQPEGMLRLAYLTDYSDLFRMDLSAITAEQWLEARDGWAGVLGYGARQLYGMTRWLLVGGLSAVVLAAAPYLLVRRPLGALPGLLMLAGLAVIYAFMFPELGRKGSFASSAIAVFPLVFAAAGGGLWAMGEWVRKRWGLNRRTLVVGIATAVLLVHTVTLANSSLIRGYQLAQADPYALMEEVLRSFFAATQPSDRAVLTDDPWHMHRITGRPCLQMPTDDFATVKALAGRFDARFCAVTGSTIASIEGFQEALDRVEVAKMAEMPLAQEGETLCVVDLHTKRVMERALELVGRGAEELRQGDHEEAIEVLRAALGYTAGYAGPMGKIRLRLAMAHVAYGDALAAAADEEGAQEQYDLALTVTPEWMQLEDVREQLREALGAAD
jgi:hypothetical protein